MATSRSITKVKLHILCTSYVTGKRMRHVTVKEDGQLIGSTETLDLSRPEFTKSIVLDYHPDRMQVLSFQLVADDGRRKRTESTVQITLKQLRIQGNWGKHEEGDLIICASEVFKTNDFLKIHLRAENLDKGGFFRKRDAYLEFNLRYTGPVSLKYAVVHRTEVVASNLNPEWVFEVPVHELCNLDYDRELLVNCCDRKKHDDPELIGSFTTTLAALLGNQKKKSSYYHTDERLSYDLTIPQEDKYGNSLGTTKKTGTIHVEECTLIYKRTFLDFVSGGLSLEFMVAIDFTGSNLRADDKRSYHYNTPEKPSVYHRVLKLIRAVSEEHDTSKSYPAFGFGAKLPPDFKDCQHIFPLNTDWDNPRCESFDELIETYLHVSNTVEYSGPTHFAPLIRKCCEMAADIQPGSKYLVLLIITDGEAMDIPETVEAVAAASVLPISIIVVGIGHWSSQEFEEEGNRKVVQDVESRFLEDRSYLVKNVVPVIKEQVVEYMEINGYEPPAPPPAYSDFNGYEPPAPPPPAYSEFYGHEPPAPSAPPYSEL